MMSNNKGCEDGHYWKINGMDDIGGGGSGIRRHNNLTGTLTVSL